MDGKCLKCYVWGVVVNAIITFILLCILMPSAHANVGDDTCKFHDEDSLSAYNAHKQHDIIFRNGFEIYCDDDNDED